MTFALDQLSRELTIADFEADLERAGAYLNSLSDCHSNEWLNAQLAAARTIDGLIAADPFPEFRIERSARLNNEVDADDQGGFAVICKVTGRVLAGHFNDLTPGAVLTYVDRHVAPGQVLH